MKEFIEKLIGRLEEKAIEHRETGFEMERKGFSNIADKQYAKQTTYLNAIEIVNQLAEEYNGGWIPCSKQLPPHSDDLLLIQCSGKPKNNIVFDNAFCLASYTKEVWLLELYPEWKGAEVIAWMPLPEPYQPKGE